jgi:hypothetical protein
MITVENVIRTVFPRGTRERSDWTKHPEWAPDLFAVCAYLVEQSGCYALLRPEHSADRFLLTENREKLQSIGADWSKDMFFLTEKDSQIRLQRLWTLLWNSREQPVVCEKDSDVPAWAIIALWLLVVADEASAGIGFFPSETSTGQIQAHALAKIFFAKGSSRKRKKVKLSRRAGARPAVNLPLGTHTLTLIADDDVVCVLPKTRTPVVGCTIRSFTHHLSLLPGRGEVKALWHVYPTKPEQTTSFNLLVVPFPYSIPGLGFSGTKASSSSKADRWGWFDVDTSTWLPKRGRSTDGAALSRFVMSLVRTAQTEVGAIHGIVLPELALDDPTYEKLRETVTRHLPSAVFLVSGVQSQSGAKRRNTAQVTTFWPGKTQDSEPQWVKVSQSKHHRWKLDRGQIRRYSLGDALDPELSWWENIDVDSREVNFFAIGRGSCFATLICEDLARVDPCQRVVRSVGPNIVIALLMDGPQTVSRWPGRNCAVLSEDPGSAILTVTSAALVDRSSRAVRNPSRSIALWRDSTGDTEELELPVGAHALCLSLRESRKHEVTLDGRSDGGFAGHWSLSGVTPIYAPKAPKWAK